MQYQVTENRLKSNEKNASDLEVKRFYASTIDKKTKFERIRNQVNRHKDGHLHVYTERIPDMNSSSLLMYSITSKSANTNVGVVFLKQKPIYMVNSRYTDSEYQAKLLYMNASSLNSPSNDGAHKNSNSKKDSTAKNNDDQKEAVYLARRYESLFGGHTFTRFRTGELFERPLQLCNLALACVSVHEPLARPPVLSVIVQDPVDPQVSVVACE
jgi:hypothetical protein